MSGIPLWVSGKKYICVCLVCRAFIVYAALGKLNLGFKHMCIHDFLCVWFSTRIGVRDYIIVLYNIYGASRG